MESQEKKKKTKPKAKTAKAAPKKILLREGLSLKELSEKTGIKSKDIIEKLKPSGYSMNVNDVISESLADLISKEFGLKLELVSFEKEMQIQPPVDPLFRVGDMGLAYDESNDQVCIIVKEVVPDTPDNEGGVVRYWCTRKQLAALGNWAAVVIERGRPICPQCLQPIEPEGHFCPKKNGHKKKNFT